MINLSQGHLNLLETCPPQFQKIYLEQLNSPINPEIQARLTWGSRFHLLMQQRELGLPIESWLQEDDELVQAIASLLGAAPNILQPHPESFRDAEHCRTLKERGYLLTVIYDLLITNSSQAQIIDWKTYFQPRNKAKLATNWQTRLYLYILGETSSYVPEQISMTYWFVKLPHKPQSLTFTYNSKQHEQTRQDLSQLLTKLDGWLQDYLNEGIALPHRPNCQDTCPYYQSWLAFPGEGNQEAMKGEDYLSASIEDIEEVSI